jgi:hypothetical protein
MICIHKGDPYTCKTCNRPKQDSVSKLPVNDQLTQENEYYGRSVMGYSSKAKKGI